MFCVLNDIPYIACDDLKRSEETQEKSYRCSLVGNLLGRLNFVGFLQLPCSLAGNEVETWLQRTSMFHGTGNRRKMHFFFGTNVPAQNPPSNSFLHMVLI